jgi:hypothetical protein
MYTRLIATTEDKTAWEYDLAISHRSPVDPKTRVSKIRFFDDSGKSLELEGWRRNMTFVEPDQWIGMRNRLCAILRRRIKDIQTNGSWTRWQLTKWFFERQMQRMNRRCIAQMAWPNYGRDGWVIDHLLPMSWFDLDDPAHRKLCQRLSNLRPERDIHNWSRRNVVTIRDVTRFVNGRLVLRKYIESQKRDKRVVRAT